MHFLSMNNQLCHIENWEKHFPLQGCSLPALKSWEQLTYKVQKQKPPIKTPESISQLAQRDVWAVEGTLVRKKRRKKIKVTMQSGYTFKPANLFYTLSAMFESFLNCVLTELKFSLEYDLHCVSSLGGVERWRHHHSTAQETYWLKHSTSQQHPRSPLWRC